MDTRDERHIERIRNVTKLVEEETRPTHTSDGPTATTTDADPRPAIRIADRVLRRLERDGHTRTTRGRRPSDSEICEALETIAAVLERPLADGGRADAERRATLLVWRTMDERFWAPAGALRDEPLRAAWRRAFDALKLRAASGLAALFVAGLEYRTLSAALVLGDLLLGRNRKDASLALAMANMLPGRAAIACRASDLAPERSASLDALRLEAIMHTGRCGSGTARIGRDLHRLTEPREALERATTMAQALDANGLDGIAAAIASNWTSFWAPCEAQVRHGARHLMLLCRSRTGTATADWNGSLDELDDETLAASLARCAGLVRRSDDATRIGGCAASALGARIATGGDANAIARHVLDAAERRPTPAWRSLLAGTADAINERAPQPLEQRTIDLVTKLREGARATCDDNREAA